MNRLGTARVLTLRSVVDERGTLEAAELPFEARRMFVVHDLAAGTSRGDHANRSTHELIVCVRGAITATIDEGAGERDVRLDAPTKALHLPPLVWVRLHDHTPGTVVVVAASTAYDPGDAIRDRAEHRRLTSGP
ncbi:MAG: FdtA/QdtA family cupin domain-containing protein [Actinomycetota bacterium]